MVEVEEEELEEEELEEEELEEVELEEVELEEEELEEEELEEEELEEVELEVLYLLTGLVDSSDGTLLNVPLLERAGTLDPDASFDSSIVSSPITNCRNAKSFLFNSHRCSGLKAIPHPPPRRRSANCTTVDCKENKADSASVR